MNDLDYQKWLPDFLGIGAQRTGTTWLWKNLRQHPEIWMPARKEIHYFERSTSYPFYRQHREKLAKQRRIIAARVLQDIRRRDWREIIRDVRFLTGLNDDRWYAALFRTAGDKIKGEITPAYATLTMRKIAHIRTIMPQTRIILLVRNPIDRAWSAVKFETSWRTGKAFDIETFSLDDLKRVVTERRFHTQGDYVRIITHWRKHFPEEQFFIGFFDDIVNNPAQLLSRVLDFLGADASQRHITDSAFEKANPSSQDELPQAFSRFLTATYYPQIEAVSELLGGPTDRWRQEAEEILQSTGKRSESDAKTP